MFSPSEVRKTTIKPLHLNFPNTPKGQAFSPFVLSLRKTPDPLSQNNHSSHLQGEDDQDKILHSIETLFRGTYQASSSSSSLPQKNTTLPKSSSSQKSLQEQLDTVKKHTDSLPSKRNGFFSLWGK